MIPSFLLSKDAIYIGIILAAIGGAWYILDDWHYKPLRVADETIKMVSEQYNTCVSDRDKCTSSLPKKAVENYQDGLGDGDDKINIDLDNLTSN